MLKLSNIKKDYVISNSIGKKFSADNVVPALRGINLEFRDTEFVAILGPSGCGKTTMLNVIGGLDRYTSGDLYINKQSTKNFKDYDWDKYRNASIGFVFQTYNLIMHQTVLANVEMALTLVGVNREERHKRAFEALKSVGLQSQAYKKPNQLSGGQMQRVAIARAIINDPDIILADEPTGALDTESSIQVMEILKSLAADRLIIMVTHNPNLAEEYATRIVKLSDGVVVSDSMPYESDFVENTELVETSTNPFVRLKNSITRRIKHKKAKVPSMKYGSAIKLSFNNMSNKLTRTALVSFAGSIGIIGIALVLAISSGFSGYISNTELAYMSQYPIAVEKSTMTMPDVMSILSSLNEKVREEYPEADEAYINKILGNLLANMTTAFSENDLVAFKEYLDENFDDKNGSVIYNYATTLNIYCNHTNEDGSYTQINPFLDIMSNVLDEGLLDAVKEYAAQINVWSELPSNTEMLYSQYDVLSGRWATEADELVLVLDEYNQIPDYMLFAIGLKNPSDVLTALNGKSTFSEEKFTFEELQSLSYQMMTNSDFCYYNNDSSLWTMRNKQELDNDYILQNSMNLKIVGVVRPNETCNVHLISGTVAYTHALSTYMIEHTAESEVVKAQQATPSISVLDGQKISVGDYQKLLTKFGFADESNPDSIYFYVSSAEGKQAIIDMMDKYADVSGKHITYTDQLALMMSSINTISDAVRNVLIAFSAISLIVSCIMIAIITYISVIERTKEIGVLRSLGARKKDIARVFNAETCMIGFISGLIGVVITYVLTIPINALIEKAIGIVHIATFVWWHAIILVAMSVILTLISGAIPSNIASHMDPVKALRSEE